MNLTRREFVKGGLATLGFLALPGTPLFAAPTGWKVKGRHPFSREGLLKTIGTPQFPPRAKLVVEIGTQATKATKGTKNGASLKIKIPMADGNPASRVYAYNVVVAGDDMNARYFKSVFFSGVNSGIGHEPNNGITEVEIPVSKLPAGKKLTIAARPLSSLGTKGKAIGTTLRV